MRFFIKFSYKGTNYHGWQEQPNANTVQAEIHKALSVILNTQTQLVGAGRTDSGVHAKQMFAHFDCDFEFDFEEIIFKLNGFLPSDIVIYDIFKVKDEAHCRFDAITRKYEYHIIRNKDPFKTNAYLLHRKLDVKLMNLACKHIVGEQDFTSFSKVNTQVFTHNCNVIYAKWEYRDNELVFTIKANRFLRNMVRAIVGTLLDIGLCNTGIDDLPKIIAAKNRCVAGKSVPAHGLFLIEVAYDFDKIRI